MGNAFLAELFPILSMLQKYVFPHWKMRLGVRQARAVVKLLQQPKEVVFDQRNPVQIFHQKTPMCVPSSSIQCTKVSETTATKEFSR